MRRALAWRGMVAFSFFAVSVAWRTAQAQPAGDPPADAGTMVERHTFFAAQADRVWAALTDKETLDIWFPFEATEIDVRPGGHMAFGQLGEPALICQLLEVEPKKKLVMTFQFQNPPMLRSEPPGRLTYELREIGPATELYIRHDQLDDSPMTARGAPSVWDGNIARLKTIVETGKPLCFTWDCVEQQQEAPLPEKHDPLAFIHGITLYVPKLTEARPWYEKVLNIGLTNVSLDWIEFSMGRPRIRIEEGKNQRTERPGSARLEFRVDNIDSIYQRLREDGVEFLQPLTDHKYRKEFMLQGPGGFAFHVWESAPAPLLRPSPSTQPSTAPADQ